MSTATRVADIPRRRIRIAFGMPMNEDEMKALWRLGHARAHVRLYEEGPVQELEAPALEGLFDAQVIAGRIVVSMGWVGCSEPPAEPMALLAYREEPRKLAVYGGRSR